MKKVINSLPRPKFIIITVVVCVALGTIAPHQGDRTKGLIVGLVIALALMTAATLRNYNPSKWEAYRDPHAYALRVQRDTITIQLSALLKAIESDNRVVISNETAKARKTLENVTHIPTTH